LSGVWLVCAVYAVIYRYRRISNAIERQQTKWVVYGLSMVTAAVLLLSELPNAVAPALVEDGTYARLVIDVLGLLILAVVTGFFGQNFDNQLVILALWQAGDGDCADAACANQLEREAAAMWCVVAWINRNALF
jgi:fumarate reductase subunit D